MVVHCASTQTAFTRLLTSPSRSTVHTVGPSILLTVSNLSGLLLRYKMGYSRRHTTTPAPQTPNVWLNEVALSDNLNLFKNNNLKHNRQLKAQMGYNDCYIPHAFQCSGVFYAYLRLSDNQFFRCPFGMDSPLRCQFLISRLAPFFTLL